MNLSKAQGLYNLILSVLFSIFTATVQLLLIYFIMNNYGTKFNGFIRMLMAFSTFIITAESALGIATIILLVKPIKNHDWITCNEIYSSSKRNYRKSAIIQLAVGIIISIIIPLFMNANGLDSIFESKSFGKGIEIKDNGSISYFGMAALALIFLFKNFINTWFFAAEENILAADEKNSIRRSIIIFSEITIYSIIILLISLEKISPLIVFNFILLTGPIKCVLLYFFVKKRYIWLKYKKNVVNLRLSTMTAQINKSSYGTYLLISTDVIVVFVLFGLNISSAFSLYMVIAFNIQLIMLNFITSFREYFTHIIAQKGRVYWESYSRYEMYTYMIAAFTFINMSILSPYFVSAIYWKQFEDLFNNTDPTKIPFGEKELITYIFKKPMFSTLVALSTSLIILCETQSILIYAKGRNSEISRFQNYLGAAYIVIVLIIGFTSKQALNRLDVNKNDFMIKAIVLMYVTKCIALYIKRLYLWIYCYKYLTYDSSTKFVFRNLLILLIPISLSIFINFTVMKNHYDVDSFKSARELFELMVFCGLTSIGVILIVTVLLLPKLFLSVIGKIPIVSKVVDNKLVEKINSLTSKFDETEIYIKNDKNLEEVLKDTKKVNIMTSNATVGGNTLAIDGLNLDEDKNVELIYKIQPEE